MHTTRQKTRLLARIRRLRGQIEGIERAVENEESCGALLHGIAGARGALAGLMCEVVEDQVTSHLVDTCRYPDALNRDAAEELLDVIRTYLK